MLALGVLDLDSLDDLDSARRRLHRIAEAHGLELVDVMTFRPAERGWIFRMLEAVHRYGAHAVIVREITELHGLEMAVTGVADLHTRWLTRRYLGYGYGYVRPSAANPGRTR
ncbi:hypothetical protein [Nocardia aurea]|uniref:hypothetical protein n=1 Tax=Nocardia aurea TaxID=2144174 RepID=UPI00339F86E4